MSDHVTNRCHRLAPCASRDDLGYARRESLGEIAASFKRWPAEELPPQGLVILIDFDNGPHAVLRQGPLQGRPRDQVSVGATDARSQQDFLSYRRHQTRRIDRQSPGETVAGIL